MNLQIIGKQNVAGVEFTGIEGGFGKGKRAMLISEIAKIHGKDVRHVNERINFNLKRFKNGTDYINLLGVDILDSQLKELGFSQQSINSYRGKGSGIYVLSERGYSKLLKVLDDDMAWELYDQLVDEYFQMREQINTSGFSPELQLLIKLEQGQKQLNENYQALGNKMNGIREVITLNAGDWRKDTTNLINKVAKKRGGFDEYRHVRNEIYEIVEQRGGYSLKTRLTNKRRRLAEDGVPKYKRSELSNVDVIADDKRLIELYIAVVKDFAIRHGVEVADE